METVFPGEWLLIGYLVFISVGVMGMIAWGVMYYFGMHLFGKTQINTALAMLHLFLFEIAVIGACSIIAAIGYVGGTAYLAHPTNPAFVSQAIATNIIPPLSNSPTSVLNDMPPVVEAVFIGLAVLATLIGLLGFLIAKSRPVPVTTT
jgi:hypothetical protein